MNKFIPVSELEGSTVGRINWDLTLPDYSPAEDIGVHIRRLGGIARWGGFNSLSINGYEGETTQLAGEIGPFGNDGSIAVTGTAKVIKAEVQRSDVPPEPKGIKDYTYYWPDATLSLNMAEIEDRVHGKRGVRNPKIWGKEIDSALKTSVRDATYKHLLEGRSLIEKSRFIRRPLTTALIAKYALYPYFTPENPPLSRLTLIYLLMGGTADKRADLVQRKPVWKGRYSIFTELQLDRVAAVEGLTRVLPIAKKI